MSADEDSTEAALDAYFANDVYNQLASDWLGRTYGPDQPDLALPGWSIIGQSSLPDGFQARAYKNGSTGK